MDFFLWLNWSPFADEIHKCVVFLEWRKGDSKIIYCKSVCNGFVWFFMSEMNFTCRLDSQMCRFLRMRKRIFENNIL